ncbi:hypothetical protein EAS62_16190 [Bradyrhizobium zhanjiangense]|uniref:Uncharacterized protein n=1 Tax=Bradyrhizobium zhanjiangense TaxID=1325107 RepID=A0ABY0DJJ5_9BRAD|nr:hypothetical protein EAS62_16190 [Bradyrhizobium zhanjiangense]
MVGTALRTFAHPASRAAATPSLRAKRSNPGCLCGKILDCFVASLLAMTGVPISNAPANPV